MTNEIDKTLIDVAGTMGRLSGTVDSLSSKVTELHSDYKEGRSAAIRTAEKFDTKFDKIEKNFNNVNNQIEKLDDRKLDKSAIVPLMKVNWLLSNWKVIAVILALLAGMGAIELNAGLLSKLLIK